MPRTRVEVDRDQKVAEIVEAAVAQLRSGGFDALSVARIARELGLAQAAVYWYFPTRDDLFVAAIDDLVQEALAVTSGTAVEDVLGFVDCFDTAQGIVASLYLRARSSPVVAVYEKEFRGRMQELLSTVVTGHVPDGDVAETAETLLCAIEGAVLLGLQGDERARVIRRVFTALVG